MRAYQPVEGPDRLPQAMVEGSTEYDWAELPPGVQDALRYAASVLRNWIDAQERPVMGELVTAQYEVENSTRPKPSGN